MSKIFQKPYKILTPTADCAEIKARAAIIKPKANIIFVFHITIVAIKQKTIADILKTLTDNVMNMKGKNNNTKTKTANCVFISVLQIFI